LCGQSVSSLPRPRKGSGCPGGEGECFSLVRTAAASGNCGLCALTVPENASDNRPLAMIDYDFWRPADCGSVICRFGAFMKLRISLAWLAASAGLAVAPTVFAQSLTIALSSEPT